MFPSNCKAILKTAENQILEYGTAKISVNNRSVDFTSNFVPLMKIGTPLKIVCYEGKSSTHVIRGEVYLSSPKLMRLVSIKITVLPGAERSLTLETSFNAKIAVPTIKTGLFNNKSLTNWTDCRVCSISVDKISFYTTWQKTDEDRSLTIEISAPIFRKPTKISLNLDGKYMLFNSKSKYNYLIKNANQSKIKNDILEFIRSYSILLLKDTLSTEY